MENNNFSNNENQPKKGLIARLIERVRNIDLSGMCTIKQKIGNLVLTKLVPIGLAIFMVMTTASCSLNDNDIDSSFSSNIGSGIVDSSGSNSSTDSTIDSSTNTDSQVKPPVKDPDKYEQYSDLLQGVLTNSYYNNLLAQAKKNPNLYTTGYFAPMPYTFLEEKGHNIQAMKDETIFANTYSFVLENEPNNLYMATTVGHENTDYYTNYLLKYTLTDQEMEEYNMLSTSLQGHFINDAISANKRAEIITTSKISSFTHEKLTSTFNSLTGLSNKFGTGTKQILFDSFDEDAQTFSSYLMNFAETNVDISKSKGKIALLNMKPVSIELQIENGIFNGPYLYPRYFTFENYKETEAKDVTLYRYHFIYKTSTTDLTK